MVEPSLTTPFGESYWVVPGKLLAGFYPGDLMPEGTRKKLTSLMSVGIRHVVNLVPKDETNLYGQVFIPYMDVLEETARLQGLQVTVARLPIQVYEVPTVQEMSVILDGIDQNSKAHRPVYVHCVGGRGRTGLVIGCYLIRHGIASPATVLEVIRGLRRNMVESYLPSLDNEIHEFFIRGWTEDIKQK